ncbi:MAG: hypothetical protein K5931_09135 [Lachnospiraceae bacterium]|nr:hypothetical protein [Lachnospiraceae bacterium]
MKKTKIKIPGIKDIFIAVTGAALCGLGLGFVNFSELGMDSVGLFYDGIRKILNLTPDQIGTASYIVSGVLFLFLFIVERKYVSIGSLIYVIVYGAFANLGSYVLEKIISEKNLYLMVILASVGFLIIYFGIALYITVDIGVDAFTGLSLWLTDLTKKPFKAVKIVFDIILAVIGFLMGGKLGVLTFITALAGGPIIAFFTKHLQRLYFRGKLKDI